MSCSTPSSLSSTSGGTTQATTPEESICTPLHPLYCFEVLESHLQGRESSPPIFQNAHEQFALFVTWNTLNPSKPHRKPTLRGCIGNFSPMPLEKGLKDYALVRFSPIKASELPNLQCCVSLLTPFTPISDPLAWTPGEHGIHLTFPNPSSSNASARSATRNTLSATYLPEICPEQGWTKEQTVLSAIQKAGYRGKVHVGDEVWKSLNVKVYGSVKASIDYQGYKAWKGGKD